MKWHRTPSRRARDDEEEDDEDDHRRLALSAGHSLNYYTPSRERSSSVSPHPSRRPIAVQVGLLATLEYPPGVAHVRLNQRAYLRGPFFIIFIIIFFTFLFLFFITVINYRHCTWISYIGPDSCVPGWNRDSLILENIFQRLSRLSHSRFSAVERRTIL